MTLAGLTAAILRAVADELDAPAKAGARKRDTASTTAATTSLSARVNRVGGSRNPVRSVPFGFSSEGDQDG